MANPCSNPAPSNCTPAGISGRVAESFSRRFHAATQDALSGSQPHPTNGDEARYNDKCGTYSKGILQWSPGVVDHNAFIAFRKAIDTASFANFELVPLGGSKTMNGPMGAYFYSYMSEDCSQFGAPSVPAPPALASPEYATELVELYWCSLLRDVAFSGLAASPTANAAATELTSLNHYAGPRNGSGKVTPALLFRGTFPGEQYGPYVSQFLVTPTNMGAQKISQTYTTYMPGVDYMTCQPDWYAVQQGIPPTLSDIPDPTPRYLHDGRGLAAYTHVDELFQAYFTAYLAMQTLKVPPNPGNPYIHSVTQNGFGTFGGPDFAATLCQVAKIALNAVWYQKWPIHLRHRPEAGGGLVHLIKGGKTFDGKPDNIIFNSNALQTSFNQYGSYLLSQPFPEGSPYHPAYPTGHGTVGGACITVLKFFYNGDFVLANPMLPTSDGINLVPWTSADPTVGAPGPLTVNGELAKLAHNITFGHGLHGGIHWRSDSDSSMLLGEAVAISFLKDLACTYAEPFTVTFKDLMGNPVTITNQ